jgi:hypothetical protein
MANNLRIENTGNSHRSEHRTKGSRHIAALAQFAQVRMSTRYITGREDVRTTGEEKQKHWIRALRFRLGDDDGCDRPTVCVE